MAGVRKAIQAAWGALSNGYVRGFLPGGPPIYQGSLKHFCVPGMNCHSCPGALGACPVGALQASLDGRRRKFPFYVLGYLAAVGLVAGRFICGWLCPFGLLQELLYRIPSPRIPAPPSALAGKVDRALRRVKYLVLAGLVLLLPLLWRGPMGEGIPFFCKYLCPVGTLEAGLPLVFTQAGLREAAGVLFRYKCALLLICAAASVGIYRPFCKYICPLGAFYSLFQKASLVRMYRKEDACTHCGACARSCGMQVDPVRDANSAECIRCGACVDACPEQALYFGIKNPGRNARPSRAGVWKNCSKKPL